MKKLIFLLLIIGFGLFVLDSEGILTIDAAIEKAKHYGAEAWTSAKQLINQLKGV